MNYILFLLLLSSSALFGMQMQHQQEYEALRNTYKQHLLSSWRPTTTFFVNQFPHEIESELLVEYLNHFVEYALQQRKKNQPLHEVEQAYKWEYRAVVIDDGISHTQWDYEFEKLQNEIEKKLQNRIRSCR